MAKRSAPQVNAGSMADIAFLLLIFFLVTTTIETDSGINRKLPPIEDKPETPPEIKMKNIFTVMVNKNDQLLVEDQLMELSELREAAIAFLDNGGDGSCDHCKGAKDIASSDNPDKAIISLQNDSETSYKAYISVQNELVAAYYFLRDRECMIKYGKTYRELETMFDDPRTRNTLSEVQFKKLEERIKEIQQLFPQKLSEAEPKRN
jgi:biopolymer transport protein ExbD